MKRPGKVKLGWKEFSVEYKPHVISGDGKDCFGLANYNKGKIFVSEDSYNDANERIVGLLHELVHMIDAHYKMELSENQVAMLTVALGDLAAQNPGLMKYIFEK